MNRGSSSNNIITKLVQENEDIVLVPLLSSNQQSTDDLLVSEHNLQDFQSFCSMYISRVIRFHNPMGLRSSRVCCFEALKSIPVVFILSIVAWSYYAYVVQMCILTIDNVPKKVIYLFIYHPLLFLFLWSYYQTMFKPLAGPPSEFYVGEAEGERIATAQTLDERRMTLLRFCRRANLPVLTRHFDGSIRYCFLCRCIKPDRAHHCSLCGKCVLRYDHHCPWTNSCVSYANYKFFVLFLGWALLFCTYVAATSLEYFIVFWQGIANARGDGGDSTSPGGKFHLLFLFFASIMFAISVSSLFFYHLYLSGKNRTTLESFRAPIFSDGPQKDGFNLGYKQNFQEIFGKTLLAAIIPIWTTRGDGVHYQVNSLLLGGLQQQQQFGGVSNDVLVPLDTTANSMNNDHNYLLNENNKMDK
ncbi:unnamed protein product [Rotaria magnacalcarata]|uniref:Palmitoyltransferase n=6 Tax=Rotaria magnacalcarata TaxID=392030 RepID=A0A815APB1_9BILA|nr:unnamed protein product [Rotaria magnacalcarata]CAF1636279.1 unnamed protein product [Rotaria magnacalcarata]CAF2044324.1 unnamed protein product [Rotaria magnacalcarata]CAF2062696.1 unnamed protein product [Rotaria magnacalcarata]CAF2164549.1 unnamed protein product [Rotaria magnacalcarata]